MFLSGINIRSWLCHLSGFLIFFLCAFTANSQEGSLITPNGSAFPKNSLYGANYFLLKAPYTIKGSFVAFFLRGHREAKKVILTGEFTNWSTTKLSMTATDSGWMTTVMLPPGKYEYKFIVDDYWYIDVGNPTTITTPEGHINSVYFRTNHLFTFPGFTNARSVYLAGSFNQWRENELKMTKTEKGWQLPLYLSNGTYLYQVIVDGKSYPYPGKEQALNEYNEMSSFVGIGPRDEAYELLVKNSRQTFQNTSEGKKLISNKYMALGNYYLEKADYSYALEYFQKALHDYQNKKIQDSIGSALLNIAFVFRRQSDFPSELTHLHQAIRVFEQTHYTKQLAEAYNRLGNHHINLGKWKNAFEAYEKAMHQYEKLSNKQLVAYMLQQLAHTSGFYDKKTSMDYLYRSLHLSEQIGFEEGKADCYWLLGHHYSGHLKDTVKGVDYFSQAMDLYTKHNMKNGMAEIFLAFSDLYLNGSDSILNIVGVRPSEKIDKAIINEKKALELYSTNRGRVQVVTLYISQTFEKAGKYDSALVYYRRWTDGQNRYYNSDRERELARLQEAFKFEKIEDSLNLQKLLMETRLQQQLALSTKEKQLEHLAFLKTQADLQNEQLSRQKKEEELTLSEKEKELQSARVKALTQEKEIGQLNQQRQWVYTGSVFLVLALIAVYFLYRWRIRSIKLEAQLIKEHSEQQRREAEFQHKLADISLTALRSQMNPHFIFNCLNSIKLYTIQNDTDAAASYLSRFSKLIRLVLDNSRSERITLKSELAALELYIQMEAMRFKEKLTYDIYVDENVETD